NGDGQADIAVSGLDTSPQLTVLLGNGNATFAVPQVFPYSIPVVPVASADFNGDGVTDIAASVLTTTTVGDIQGQISVLLSGLASSSTAAITVNGISIVGTGPHRIDATYSGDSTDKPSSGSLSLTAQPVQTTLTFSAAPANGGFGQPVTLTAAIAPNTPQQEHLPTGTVTFSIGSTTVGTATVANGAATLTSTTLPIGTDNITATYSGDANFASSSATAMET